MPYVLNKEVLIVKVVRLIVTSKVLVVALVRKAYVLYINVALLFVFRGRKLPYSRS